MRLFLALLTLLAVTPSRAAEIKLATWNLNWFSLRQQGNAAFPSDVVMRRPEDFTALRAYADRLHPDVAALQEVDGVAAVARLFDPNQYQILTIREDVVQQVALVVRRGISVMQNEDLTALDVEPPAALHHLRNGLDATVRFPDGQTLRILVVHLKTGCHTQALAPGARGACGLLARQIAPLAAWVRARATQGGAYAVLGDFNRVFDSSEELGAALHAAAPLLRVTAGHSDPCWEGGSFIDHIFLGGPAGAWLAPQSLKVMRYRTDDVNEKERLSDHCPVSVKLEVP